MADGEQRDMVREKDGSLSEIRTQGELSDGRPALDEILARGAFVHLEQMAHDPAGTYLHLNFGVHELSDQGDE